MKKSMIANFVSVTMLSGMLPGAHATLTPTLERGEELIQIPRTGKLSEVCVIPLHFKLDPTQKKAESYKKGDLEDEQQLCRYTNDVQVPEGFMRVAVCAKINSTNPGLNFFSVPEGKTVEDIEKGDCSQPDKKLAKYKNSTSCSYAPSLLAYYHLSRLLGGVADVPVAVLRTFDREDHQALGLRAQKQVSKDDLIGQTWSTLMKILKDGSASPKKDLIFTDDFKQSYGALQKNPRGEAFYKEFFNGGGDKLARANNFKKASTAQNLSKGTTPVAKLVGRTLNADNLQKFQALKDAADMIVLDTILSQRDRFGNIHYETRYQYNEPKADGTFNLKSSKMPPVAEPGQTAPEAFPVKEMLLKDNDCGVSSDENIAIQAGLPAVIGHINPDTYYNLLRLASVADTAEFKKIFTPGMLFDGKDFSRMQTNLKSLATDLQARCKTGKLQLDLDRDEHFAGGEVKPKSCDI